MLPELASVRLLKPEEADGACEELLLLADDSGPVQDFCDAPLIALFRPGAAF